MGESGTGASGGPGLGRVLGLSFASYSGHRRCGYAWVAKPLVSPPSRSDSVHCGCRSHWQPLAATHPSTSATRPGQSPSTATRAGVLGKLRRWPT